MPGRERRLGEPPFKQLRPLVEACGQALLSSLDRPFAFFGYSLGARVCFEVARWLRSRQGVTPRALFVAARRAPHIPAAGAGIHNLPEPQFLEGLSNLGGIPRQVLENPALLRLMLPLLRADFALSYEYGYQPEPPLDCPITAFGGLDDEHVNRDSLESWREHTRGAFALHMLPGGHFFLRTAAPMMLGIIDQELAHLSRAQ
jgi:medium-chain acyl-[acyl-carrier-protein] hydrolase